MNIFHKFTRRCLRQNKTRTFVTILGIVLSMSLFTAVIEGAYSGLNYLYRCEADSNGYWQGMEIEANAEDIESLSSSNKVKTVRTWTELGWAEIGSSNEYKPYLLVRGIEKDTSDLVAINLVSGRMPENDSEILIPAHLADNGDVKFKLNQEITLDLGRRETLEGLRLNAQYSYEPGEEHLVYLETKTYTVVGFYDRFCYELEERGCPGYTALTLSSAKGITKDVFFEMKNAAKFYEESPQITDRNRVIVHDDLLNFAGVTTHASINRLIRNFAIVLVVLICFGSISLIYNSFAISVSERTKLFGILKSVGATKAQIRDSVRYEALVLAGIGIPIGLLVGLVGIGTTLYCLRYSFGVFTNSSTTEMRMVINPWMLLLAAVVCLITTLVAASKPSRQAIKVSPIDSIRQQTDVKIKAKEVKTSKLTTKLFGFEGMMASKNFKRNKKRYRTVVMSLFMSVVLFIGTSSFCAYLKKTTGILEYKDPAIDIKYQCGGDDYKDALEIMNKLSGVNGVTSALIKTRGYNPIYIKSDDYTDSSLIKESLSVSYNGDAFDYLGHIIFVNDEAFIKLCELNHLNASDYLKAENPQGILINNFQLKSHNESGDVQISDATLVKEKNLPINAYYEIVDYPSEGVMAGVETGEDGKRYALVYTKEYYYEAFDKGVPDEELDKTQATWVPLDEIVTKCPLTIGAVISNTNSWFETSSPELIYPASLMSVVVNNEYFYASNVVCFTCDNHKQVYADMLSILKEEGYNAGNLSDEASYNDSNRMAIKVVNVFCYGFIIIISLIALANVFNTITTNISLRKRELAMLKSIGMDSKGFNKMMNYECIIYGVKGLGWGLPVSIAFSFLIYLIVSNTYRSGFFVPVLAIIIAVVSVFLVVFGAMLFTMKKINAENTIDALKNENI